MSGYSLSAALRIANCELAYSEFSSGPAPEFVVTVTRTVAELARIVDDTTVNRSPSRWASAVEQSFASSGMRWLSAVGRSWSRTATEYAWRCRIQGFRRTAKKYDGECDHDSDTDDRQNDTQSLVAFAHRFSHGLSMSYRAPLG